MRKLAVLASVLLAFALTLTLALPALSYEPSSTSPYVLIEAVVDPDYDKGPLRYEKILNLAEVNKDFYLTCHVQNTNYYHTIYIWWISPNEYRIESNAALGSPRTTANFSDFQSKIPLPQTGKSLERMVMTHRLLWIYGRLIVTVSWDKNFLEERSKRNLQLTGKRSEELDCGLVKHQ